MVVNAPCAIVDAFIRSVRVVAGRKVDVSALVGAREIADRLKDAGAKVAGPQVVHEWRKRHPDFPAPVAELSMGLVFLWPDVERWAKRTGRLT